MQCSLIVLAIVLALSASSAFLTSTQKNGVLISLNGRNGVQSSNSALLAKKRRSRAKAGSGAAKTKTTDSVIRPRADATTPATERQQIFGKETINNGGSFVVPDLTSLQKSDSRLDPLAGTASAKKKAYEEEASGVERWMEKMTAPTPKGQEPEAVKLVKQITWGAVIVLVLVEIFVSVKVGGAPFDPSKASLPSLPNFKMFTGGAGPPTLPSP